MTMPAPADPDFIAPRGYLLTWTTYGTWLHGDDAGSVTRHNNTFGTPLSPPDEWIHDLAKRGLKYDPVTLSPECRVVVEKAIHDHAAIRRWDVRAQNARSNHVHVVIGAPTIRPEPILTQFKDWGTKRLRRAKLIPPVGEVWTPHGSTRYLYEPGSLEAAIDYVLNQQDTGRPGRNA
jgi:hypothetical protein